jgi:hypothetical protein
MTAPANFTVFSHDVLFEEPRETCHACNETLDDHDDDGFDVTGRGLMVFYRGDERRVEEPGLCPTCGAAIGMTMLTRWAIEEEEG